MPTQGVSAVVLNVTVTQPTSGGYLTVYANGLTRPTVSNLNFARGQTVPNLVVVGVGAGGKVALFNGSAGTVQVIADVAGYFLTGYPTEAGTFGSVAPMRALDTRIGLGAPAKTVGPLGTLAVEVTGLAAIPAAGVSAVVVNVTVAQPTSGGYLTVYANGTTRPTASSLNFAPGQTVPNLVVAPVSADGRVALFNGSAGTVHLIADVAGYFLGGTPALPGTFGSVGPARVLDTRRGVGTSGSAAVAASGAVPVQVTGLGGVPARGVSAVAVNVTVTQPQSSGYLTAYADGTARPTASNLNFLPGMTVPNLVLAPVGSDGKIVLYNGSPGTVHLIADVAGYFLADPITVDTQSLTNGIVGLPYAARLPASGGFAPYAFTATGLPDGLTISADGAITGRPTTAQARTATITVADASGVTVVLAAAITVNPAARVRTISAGSGDACALVYGGEVACWGLNNTGQLGDGTTVNRSTPTPVQGIDDATAISAGPGSSCAVVAAGAVKCWGANTKGELGDGTTTSSAVPVLVVGITDAVEVSVGGSRACALLADRTLKCWGDNSYGGLGDGTVNDSLTPVSVTGISNAGDISGPTYHSCALLTDHTVKCWGQDSNGELGDGATINSPAPVPVNGIDTAIAMGIGAYHSCALLAAGTVRCWGSNASKELDNDTTVNSTTPVDAHGISDAIALGAGFFHDCAVLRGGDVRCWGLNTYGEVGPPPAPVITNLTIVALHGVTSIAGGAGSTCALISDGSVSCWGYNSIGQLGNGTTKTSGVPVPVVDL